jgi:hypothetical protein
VAAEVCKHAKIRIFFRLVGHKKNGSSCDDNKEHYPEDLEYSFHRLKPSFSVSEWIIEIPTIEKTV